MPKFFSKRTQVDHLNQKGGPMADKKRRLEDEAVELDLEDELIEIEDDLEEPKLPH